MRSERLAAMLVGLLALACGRPQAEIEAPEKGASDAADAREKDPIEARLRGLCVHSFNVLAGENESMRSSPTIEDEFVERCVASNRERLTAGGEAAWNQRASCLQRAQTTAELAACDGRVPQAKPDPTVSAGTAEPEALCRHMLDLFMRDQAGAAGAIDPSLMEEVQRMCTEEVTSKRDEDPAGYVRVANCVMAARQASELEACE